MNTMLLEFRVCNFCSIRDWQTLSFVASSDRAMARTNLMATGLKSPSHVVRAAVVYGPNASGKSTLLRALNYARAVVAESATVIQPGQTYNVQPFRLDPSRARQPTEFELSFVVDGIRHQYSYAMTPQRIVRETLLVYRSVKPTRLFERRLSDDGQTYHFEFSSYLSGPRKLWQESTRPNALFLSTAAQLNSEVLNPVFRSIVNGIVFLPAGAMFDPDTTTAMLATTEGRAAIRDFLSAADVGITDVQAVSRKGIRSEVSVRADGVAQVNQQEGEHLVPLFEHKGGSGTALFEFHEESGGTQRLYGMAAAVLGVLRDGRALIVDELDTSMHTLLVRRLVSMFHDPELNRAGAQLIFSTHDTTLLDHTLFRRDQIWFTEKGADQATRVYPLTDFSPRKNEAWEKGYLSGRYGAVPFFEDWPRTLERIPPVETQTRQRRTDPTTV